MHVGDKVVTSSISEKYLPGILIGYISELNNDSNNLTKSGTVNPAVDFKHLQEVLVIRTRKTYVASDGTVAEEPADAGESTTLTAPRAGGDGGSGEAADGDGAQAQDNAEADQDGQEAEGGEQ